LITISAFGLFVSSVVFVAPSGTSQASPSSSLQLSVSML
jgi:hypothetical protein